MIHVQKDSITINNVIYPGVKIVNYTLERYCKDSYWLGMPTSTPSSFVKFKITWRSALNDVLFTYEDDNLHESELIIDEGALQ